MFCIPAEQTRRVTMNSLDMLSGIMLDVPGFRKVEITDADGNVTTRELTDRDLNDYLQTTLSKFQTIEEYSLMEHEETNGDITALRVVNDETDAVIWELKILNGRLLTGPE